VLGLFAGVETPGEAKDAAPMPPGGLASLSRFLESTVPETERSRISEVLLRILNGALFELLNVAREHAGAAPAEPSEKTQSFMSLAVLSLSDSFFYPAPVLLELADFQQVQASVFQVARAPGKTLVYLGAVLLIIGVFAMLYVRERRLWVWLQEDDAGGTRIATALSTTRRTLDADAEFERLKHAILKEAP
jgi:cytochrome c biogenesis protein